MNTTFKPQKEKKMLTQNSISIKIPCKSDFKIDFSIQKLRKFAASRSAVEEILKRILQVKENDLR